MIVLSVNILFAICYLFAFGKGEKAYVQLKGTKPVSVHECEFPEHITITVRATSVNHSFSADRFFVDDAPTDSEGSNKSPTKDDDPFRAIQDHRKMFAVYKDNDMESWFEVKCVRHKQYFTLQLYGFIVGFNENVLQLSPDVASQEQEREHEDVEYVLTPLPHSHGAVAGLSSRRISPNRKQHPRLRRSADDINIDVLAVIGNSVYQRWDTRSVETNSDWRRRETLDNIQQYFTFLFDLVNRRFKTASERYNFNLVGFFIQDAGESPWLTETRQLQGNPLNGDLMLEAVANWTHSDQDLPDNDVVVAFETFQLFSSTRNSFVRDFSYKSSICSTDRSAVVLVQEFDLFILDSLSVSHGLGHAFGAEDDGDSNNCSSSDHFIMASDYKKLFSSGSTNPYHFSTCSSEYFQNYTNLLLSNNSSRSCLLERHTGQNVTDLNGTLPGEVYDPDTQCRLIYDAQSYYCFNRNSGLNHDDICIHMNCFFPNHDRCYQNYAADGTSCGHKKWCMAGDCVFSANAPETHDVCVHGDQTKVGYGVTEDCPAFVDRYRFYCYYALLPVICCQSCLDRASPDEGCEYGDNTFEVSNCNYSYCDNNRNDTSYINWCCETCKDFRTTALTQTTSVTDADYTKSTNRNPESSIDTTPSKFSVGTTESVSIDNQVPNSTSGARDTLPTSSLQSGVAEESSNPPTTSASSSTEGYSSTGQHRSRAVITNTSATTGSNVDSTRDRHSETARSQASGANTDLSGGYSSLVTAEVTSRVSTRVSRGSSKVPLTQSASSGLTTEVVIGINTHDSGETESTFEDPTTLKPVSTSNSDETTGTSKRVAAMTKGAEKDPKRSTTVATSKLTDGDRLALGLGIGIPVAVLILVLALSSFCFVRRKKQKSANLSVQWTQLTTVTNNY